MPAGARVGLYIYSPTTAMNRSFTEDFASVISAVGGGPLVVRRKFLPPWGKAAARILAQETPPAPHARRLARLPLPPRVLAGSLTGMCGSLLVASPIVQVYSGLGQRTHWDSKGKAPVSYKIRWQDYRGFVGKIGYLQTGCLGGNRSQAGVSLGTPLGVPLGAPPAVAAAAGGASGALAAGSAGGAGPGTLSNCDDCERRQGWLSSLLRRGGGRGNACAAACPRPSSAPEASGSGTSGAPDHGRASVASASAACPVAAECPVCPHWDSDSAQQAETPPPPSSGGKGAKGGKAPLSADVYDELGADTFFRSLAAAMALAETGGLQTQDTRLAAAAGPAGHAAATVDPCWAPPQSLIISQANIYFLPLVRC